MGEGESTKLLLHLIVSFAFQLKHPVEKIKEVTLSESKPTFNKNHRNFKLVSPISKSARFRSDRASAIDADHLLPHRYASLSSQKKPELEANLAGEMQKTMPNQHRVH